MLSAPMKIMKGYKLTTTANVCFHHLSIHTINAIWTRIWVMFLEKVNDIVLMLVQHSCEGHGWDELHETMLWASSKHLVGRQSKIQILFAQ